MRKLILFCILFFFLAKVDAQKKYYEFTLYTDTFSFELQEFMYAGASKDRKKELEPLIFEFANFWNSDTLAEEGLTVPDAAGETTVISLTFNNSSSSGAQETTNKNTRTNIVLKLIFIKLMFYISKVIFYKNSLTANI